jgi:hypothetical protein
LDIIFAGVLLAALGILSAVYIINEERHGRLPFKYLSLKSNIRGNLVFGLIIFGITIIILGGIIS